MKEKKKEVTRAAHAGGIKKTKRRSIVSVWSSIVQCHGAEGVGRLKS